MRDCLTGRARLHYNDACPATTSILSADTNHPTNSLGQTLVLCVAREQKTSVLGQANS